MPRSQQIITAFENGEVSPTLGGRVETEQYPFFCSLLENMFVDKHGGVFGRGGMHFVLETKFPQKKSRLIPFVFSQSESYVLEFGDRYIRFFRKSGYVENLQAVTAYLGDATTTIYHYPHPEVLEANIEVYKGDIKQTITTDYTVAVSDPLFNYISDFSVTAAWDLNYDDGAGVATNPWINDGLGTVVSPAESTPILRHDATNFPRGGVADFHVNIDSFALTEWDYTHSTTAEQVLTTEFTTTHQITIDKAGKEIDVDFFCRLSVKVNNQDTFTYQLLRVRAGEADIVILSNTFLVDNDQAFDVAMPPVFFTDTDTQVGDVVRMQWKVISGGSTDAKIVSTAASLDAKLIVDPNAQVHYYSVQGNDVEGTVQDYTPVVGQWDIALDHLAVGAYPLRIKFYTDEGLSVTFSGINASQTSAGYDITFVTAPANGDVIYFLDGSSVESTNEKLISAQHYLRDAVSSFNLTDQIYEIESPFLEDELDDLYYTQANDVMFICHYKHKPQRLTRYTGYDWRVEEPAFAGAVWDDAAYNSGKGFPRVVAFFQERLWFASTLDKPQTFWGSRAADFYEFTIPGDTAPYVPDDPVEYTLASYTQEVIEWFSSERVFLIGTAATEHRLDPDQYIAVDRLPKVSKMTSYGGAHQIPIYMGNLTCFVHSSGKQLRSFKQDGQSIIEAYSSIDIGWLSSHLFEDYAFKQPAYALVPHGVAVMTRLDGVMLSASYDPSSSEGNQNDLGWARQITDGLFTSTAVIPNLFEDQVWAIIEIEIDDIDNPIFDESDPPVIIGYEKIKNKNVVFMDDNEQLDSMLTYPPDDGTTYPSLIDVGGLGYLEGKTVSIIADGALHPDRVVSGGQISLDYPAETLSIGLGFSKKVVATPFEGGNPGGTSQGMHKRWIQVWANMLDSANPIINGKRPPSRTPSTPMNTREPNRTKAVRSIKIGFDRLGQITVEQDLPLKLHLLSLYGQYETHAG